MFILGLHGPAGAGKDTVADYMVSEHGWTKKVSFSKNLKEICKAVFYLSEYQVEDQRGKMDPFRSKMTFTSGNLGSIMLLMSRTHANYPISNESMQKVRSLVGRELMTPREVLQLVGTDVCRELIPSYHMDCFKNQLDFKSDDHYIITDVRFPNEADMVVNDLGGVVVKLKRDNNEISINRRHASETSLSDWGGFFSLINNDQDGVQTLYTKVDKFIEEELKPWMMKTTQ